MIDYLKKIDQPFHLFHSGSLQLIRGCHVTAGILPGHVIKFWHKASITIDKSFIHGMLPEQLRTPRGIYQMNSRC